MMVNRKVATCVAIAGLGLVMVATPVAGANPSPAQEHDAAMVCRLLDVDHTNAGIEAIVRKMLIDSNMSSETTGNTLALATVKYCPEYADEMLHGLKAMEHKYKSPTRHPAMVPGCTDESDQSCLLPTGVIS